MSAEPKATPARRPILVTPRPASPLGRLLPWFTREIDTLYPGSFALVMATGIISNAFYFESPRLLSDALFAINLLAYPWLVVATVLRAARVPRALWADLTNPRLVFSFFTIVAATDVLGVGVMLRGFAGVGLLLWLFALVLWFVSSI